MSKAILLRLANMGIFQSSSAAASSSTGINLNYTSVLLSEIFFSRRVEGKKSISNAIETYLGNSYITGEK